MDLFHRLLTYFNIEEKDYAELIKPVSKETFALNHRFKDMEEAVALTKEAMSKGEKIAIYGDYDADGIMGTSILVKMFKYLNYNVNYYIPNRYKDGYGLTLSKAMEFVDKGVSLLITVDNGVSCFEQIKYLKDHSVKVIVLDHHTIQENLPNADYILHPTYSSFGSVASSGAFVAFNFSRVMLGRFDKYLSTLAAISLISDMMPLNDYNRELLRIVFQDYQEGEFLPIDLLKESDPFNETTIGMRIAPKINALGRLIDNDSINDIVKFFTSDNEQEILNYINWINENNEERKIIAKTAIEENDVTSEEGVIIIQTNIKEGVIGLVASSLCNKYQKPAYVFTYDEEGNLKGSVRSLEGFDVVESFNECKDLLSAAGGHTSAGGCSIKKENFDAFKKRIINFAKSHPVTLKEKESIPLNIREVTFESFDLVQSFAPFGEGWKAPIFSLKRIRSGALTYSRSLEHIMTNISQGVKITGFGFSKEFMSRFNFVDLYGTLRTSYYRGITSLEFFVKEIKKNED